MVVFFLNHWLSVVCLAEQEEERNSVAVPSCFTESEDIFAENDRRECICGDDFTLTPSGPSWNDG